VCIGEIYVKFAHIKIIVYYGGKDKYDGKVYFYKPPIYGSHLWQPSLCIFSQLNL